MCGTRVMRLVIIIIILNDNLIVTTMGREILNPKCLC